MTRLTARMKEKVLTLYADKVKAKDICKIMNSTLTCLQVKKLSVKTIRYFLKKVVNFNRFSDLPRSGQPRKFTLKHYVLLDNTLLQNDEATSVDLQKLIFENTGDWFSLSTIKKARREIDWVATTPRYCQQVKDRNKVVRREWCERMIREEEDFHNVIFTDESTIQLDAHARVVFRKSWEPAKLKARQKHPFSVHVWAGISKMGATKIRIFSGIMDSTFYQDILSEVLVPFIHTAYPKGARFQQDNCPMHVSKSTKAFMEEKGINWWPTPAESPDLNPIEMVWHELKAYLRKTIKPRLKEELVNGIQKFWRERMTPEKCTKYINHIHKVIPEVVKLNGRASGHWIKPKGPFQGHQIPQKSKPYTHDSKFKKSYLVLIEI